MMSNRPLGATGMMISPISLGTVKFGRNQGVKYPNAFSLPSDQTINDLLSQAFDGGINLLDTAPAYGTAEARLGHILKRRKDRERWHIFTKAGERFCNDSGTSSYDFSAKAIKASVEASLKNLHTDYLDGLMIHSDGRDIEIIEQDDVFTTLQDLKTRGLVRAIGMSTKTCEGGLRALSALDMAMISLNPEHQEELPVATYARQHNKGILIKKAMGSGHLASTPKDARDAIAFCLKTPGVTSVVTGTITPDHLAANILWASECESS